MVDVRSPQEGKQPDRASGDEPPSPASTRFVVRTALQVWLVVLGVAAALWVLYRLRGIVLLLVLAVFFAYLVAPLVGFFRRPVIVGGRKFVLPLPVAIGIVFVLLFGSLVTAFALLLPVISAQIA